MASQGSQKPNIADFFKPRNNLPQKRSSPTYDAKAEESSKRAKSPTPSTPKTPLHLRNGDTRGYGPLSVPRSGSAISIPIRSPRVSTPQAHSIYGSGRLLQPKKHILSSSPIASPYAPSPSPITPDVQRTERSVVQDGEVVEVLGSDEESDTDSLPSISELLDFGKSKTSKKPPDLKNKEEEQEDERVELLRMFSQSPPARNVRPKRPLIKPYERLKQEHTMSKLLDDFLNDEETDDLFAKAKSGLKDPEGELEAAGLEEPSRAALASLIRNDSDEEGQTNKLVNAVSRTEAFASDEKYNFFGAATGGKDTGVTRIELPEDGSTEKLWYNKASRTRMILSGHAASLAGSKELPETVLHWMLSNVAIEDDEEICTAYIETIRQASPHWTLTNVSAYDIRMLFEALGARSDVLESGTTIQKRPSAGSTRPISATKKVVSVLALIRAIFRNLDFAAMYKALSLVIRLALDTDAMKDGLLAKAVEQTLSNLISHPQSEARSYVCGKLLTDLPRQIHDNTLRAQLFDHLDPDTALSARFRLCLAHRFLFGEKSTLFLDDQNTSVKLPGLTTHVQSTPIFQQVSQGNWRNVDWSELKALTRILDVALADGGRPSAFASRKEETAFNREVDALADAVNDVFASITDTGVSHMRRSEAKDTLRALHYRLLYAVRTEPRPKKSIFGIDGDKYREVERKKSFMSGYFQKGQGGGADSSKTEKVSTGHATPSVTLSTQTTASTDISESEVRIREQLGLTPLPRLIP